MLNAVSNLVRKYNISPNCVRAAVIRYSSSADASIHLNSYSDVDSLVQAIGQIQLLGGSSSNLATALDLLRSQAFASNVVRGGAARTAIIITDQLQFSQQITTAANNLKSQGVSIIAVGITGPGRVDFMNSITSNNATIHVGTYSQLTSGALHAVAYGCYTPPSKCMWLLK